MLLTSSSLFRLLGARPLYGRLLLPDDDVPGKPAVVILSHAFWTADLQCRPRHRRPDHQAERHAGRRGRQNQFTVVGVLGPDFLLNDEIMPTVASIRQMDVFLPLPLGADAVNRRGDENYNLMARLKPGVTMAQAQADVAASPHGFATRTSATGRSRSASSRCSIRSSETCGWPCWCSSVRWRWCC